MKTNDIQLKEKTRNQIAQDIEKFLLLGGEIEVIEMGKVAIDEEDKDYSKFSLTYDNKE